MDVLYRASELLKGKNCGGSSVKISHENQPIKARITIVTITRIFFAGSFFMFLIITFLSVSVHFCRLLSIGAGDASYSEPLLDKIFMHFVKLMDVYR